MTDPRSAQPGSRGTSGQDAGAGGAPRLAPAPGNASARPDRPGAASPAGWFPSPTGEAAPPVRHREPARSDRYPAYAEPRPTSTYRTPAPSAPGGARRPAGLPATPVTRASRSASGGDTRVPETRWPAFSRPGPRHIPVVGPTQAIVPPRDPVSARGTQHPAHRSPPGPGPGSLQRDRHSGWQLAHRVWQDSGVSWEHAPAAADAYSPETDPYAANAYSAPWYPAGPVAADRYEADQDEAEDYEADQDEAERYTTDPDEP